MSEDTSFGSRYENQDESRAREAIERQRDEAGQAGAGGDSVVGGGLGEAEGVPEDGGPAGPPPLAGRAAQPREQWRARRRPGTRRREKRTEKPSTKSARGISGEQRLVILDCWLRSKLPAREFAEMVGVSPHALYTWKKRFEEEGPAGLVFEKKKGRRGSRLPDHTRRAIVLMKESHPDWGQDRIHDVLCRTEGWGASPGAIGRVLAEEGWEAVEVPTQPHPPKTRRFERTRPNELWQTDLFTFTLKREGRRVHLVGFMDDFSRFMVGFGLHASASGTLVREVFEASIANYGAPVEVLTDNGSQYHTWRGKSEFKKLCERRGIRQVVASPRHPQTLGKIERFWGSLWRECVQSAIFRGLEDARRRIALFIDHYNFQRPHQGIGGLVPADRFFEASEEVKQTLKSRVAANALELARHGEPRKSFYLTGRVGDEAISLHAEGERVVMTKGDGSREEVDLGAPGVRAKESGPTELPEAVSSETAPRDHPATAEAAELGAPGASELDAMLDRLEKTLDEEESRLEDEGGAA